MRIVYLIAILFFWSIEDRKKRGLIILRKEMSLVIHHPVENHNIKHNFWKIPNVQFVYFLHFMTNRHKPPFLLPATTKLGQGNIFTGVCLSTGGRAVCLSACWDTHPPPQSRQPPKQTPPPEQTTPRTRHPPGPGPPPTGKQTPAYGL